MDGSDPLTLEQRNAVLIAIYRDVHRRRPELFRGGGEPWRPGGIYQLADALPAMLRAAAAQRHHEPDVNHEEWLTAAVCPSCDYHTPCGYCAHRCHNTCVLRQEAAHIVPVVLAAVTAHIAATA